MISYYYLTRCFKRSMLEITSETSSDILWDCLRPLHNKNLPENITFKVVAGKKNYDIIGRYGYADDFYSQKFIDILSQFVDMSNMCYPIKIDGIEEQYYVINNLKAYPFWNRKEHTFMDDPYYFGVPDENIHIAGIEDTSIILLSEEVKNALLKNKISNISLLETFGCSFEEFEEIKKSGFKPQIHVYKNK